MASLMRTVTWPSHETSFVLTSWKGYSPKLPSVSPWTGGVGGQQGGHGIGGGSFRHSGGSQPLTSAPTQGLHPTVRTEAWKFLTGYYSWQSSQDERLTVDSTRR